MKRKNSKVLKIISVILSISIVVSLSVYFAFANDKYRLAVFTKNAVTYDVVNASDYKYNKIGDLGDKSSLGSYYRIDHHQTYANPFSIIENRNFSFITGVATFITALKNIWKGIIGDIESNINEDIFRIRMEEGSYLDAEVGLFFNSSAAQGKGFDNGILGDVDITWETSAPEYAIKLEPSNDGKTCRIKAVDSTILENSKLLDALKDAIDNIDLPSRASQEDKEIFKAIKKLIKESDPKTIDVDGIINLLNAISEGENNTDLKISDAIADACGELAEVIDFFKYIKQIDRRIKVTCKRGNTIVDITYIIIDVKNNPVPEINPNIYNIYDSNGNDILDNGSVGTDFLDAKSIDAKSGKYTVEAVVNPLRFSLKPTWEMRNNKSQSYVKAKNDSGDTADLKLNKPGKTSVLVASPETDGIFNTIDTIATIINNVTAKSTNDLKKNEWKRNLILKILGLDKSSDGADAFRTAIDLYLKFSDSLLNKIPGIRTIALKLLTRYSNRLLKTAASSQITFNVK